MFLYVRILGFRHNCKTNWDSYVHVGTSINRGVNLFHLGSHNLFGKCLYYLSTSLRLRLWLRLRSFLFVCILQFNMNGGVGILRLDDGHEFANLGATPTRPWPCKEPPVHSDAE